MFGAKHHNKLICQALSVLLLVLCVGVPAPVFAETIELVNYYPVPVRLEDVDAGGATVGDGYSDQTALNGVLLVEDRIGIGTAEPQAALDIYKEDEAFIRVTGAGVMPSPNNYSGIEFSADTNADGEENTVWQFAHKRRGADHEGDLYLSYFDGFAWQPRMVFRPDGTLGIGDLGALPLPRATLEVRGDMRIVGETIFGGDVTVAGELDIREAIADVLLEETTRDGEKGVIYQKRIPPRGHDPFVPLMHTYAPHEYHNLFVGQQAGNFSLGIPGTEDNIERKFGGYNIGIGFKALTNLDTAKENIALGYQALKNLHHGMSNDAYGSYALEFLNEGRFNVALGGRCLRYLSQESYNTGIGYDVGKLMRGERNVHIGYAAGGDQTSSGYPVEENVNVAIGYEALSEGAPNDGHGYNVAVGTRALTKVGRSSQNTALGLEAGYSVGLGGERNGRNVFLGYKAGRSWRWKNRLFIANEASDDDVLIYGHFRRLGVNSSNHIPHVKIRNNLSLSQGALHANAFGDDATNTLSLEVGIPPASSPENVVQLYARDVSGLAELQVRDEVGNVTTLSPHNFSLIPQGASEPLAWAYYSEQAGQAINVDMLKMVRLVEALSGEQLVYTMVPLEADQDKDHKPLSIKALEEESEQLMARFKALKAQNQGLRERLQQYRSRR